MVYKWKYGIPGVQAQDAGEYFEHLERREGEIKPKTVVDDARPQSALLHPAFEWNDTEAAERYREYQAKQVIRNIVVVQERDDDDGPITTRAVVNVSSKTYHSPLGKQQTAKYVSIKRALSEPDMKQTLFENALAELKAFQAKYKGISQFAELFAEIDRLTGSVGK